MEIDIHRYGDRDTNIGREAEIQIVILSWGGRWEARWIMIFFEENKISFVRFYEQRVWCGRLPSK